MILDGKLDQLSAVHYHIHLQMCATIWHRISSGVHQYTAELHTSSIRVRIKQVSIQLSGRIICRNLCGRCRIQGAVVLQVISRNCRDIPWASSTSDSPAYIAQKNAAFFMWTGRFAVFSWTVCVVRGVSIDFT